MARRCLGKGEKADKMVVREATKMVLGAKTGSEESELVSYIYLQTFITKRELIHLLRLFF